LGLQLVAAGDLVALRVRTVHPLGVSHYFQILLKRFILLDLFGREEPFQELEFERPLAAVLRADQPVQLPTVHKGVQVGSHARDAELVLAPFDLQPLLITLLIIANVAVNRIFFLLIREGSRGDILIFFLDVSLGHSHFQGFNDSAF